ncbi:MAG: NP1 [Feline bocaparvovirus 4]|nr:MAG: NP1 [Feline bocaparvovirus 2]UZV41799.1 MAG: NP1 [Feline bocaparvovirus 4]
MSSGECSKDARKRHHDRNRTPSPVPSKKGRWSLSSHRRSGEKCSVSSPETSNQESHQSRSTALNHSLTKTGTLYSVPFVKVIKSKYKNKGKPTPLDVFVRHKAKSSDDCPNFCGFYWHSTRLARFGTDYIFNIAKPQFQSYATNNLISWDQCRDILFEFKKNVDFKYRSMMYHFALGEQCNKCNYWDQVYTAHLAHVSIPTIQEDDEEPFEVTDNEMLAVAMEVDGTNQ